jgi:hypothetical protein
MEYATSCSCSIKYLLQSTCSVAHNFKHQHVHILSRPDLAQHGGYSVVEESGAFPAAYSVSHSVC